MKVTNSLYELQIFVELYCAGIKQTRYRVTSNFIALSSSEPTWYFTNWLICANQKVERNFAFSNFLAIGIEATTTDTNALAN